MSLQIDAIDRKLLQVLQDDSRRSMAELGDAVGLSASACHRRVKGLEDNGAIAGYRAVVDIAVLGLGLQFFIEIELASQSEGALDAFEAAVRNVPEVLECHLMAGQADYLLRVACHDADDFERIHRRLVSRLPGVARVRSNMRIRAVKTATGFAK